MSARHVARKLRDEQLEAFDVEYVGDSRWQIIEHHIRSHFGTNSFSFLDVGGGNGIFADRILNKFPGANGTVLDNSPLLLSRNHPHVRKQLVEDTVENLADMRARKAFDLICFNWLMHHLVGDSYVKTLENMKNTLVDAEHLLSDAGRISIFENIYDGFPIDNFPEFLIFSVTSSKRLAPMAKRLGANTAGIGVCFQSARGWARIIEESALRIVEFSRMPKRTVPLPMRVALGLKVLEVGHFWCRKRAIT